MPCKITLFPNIKYNYLVLKEGVATEEEKAIYSESGYEPTWRDIDGAMIVANFNYSLSSSLIDGIESNIVRWRIYRLKIGENREYQVAEVDANQLYLLDYLCKNTVSYEYFIVAILEDGLSVSLNSNPIVMNSQNYSLTSLIEIKPNVYAPKQIWTFAYNASLTETSQNRDVTVFQTYGRTPKVSYGQSNYQTFGFSCLLGDIKCPNGEYYEPVELLEKWQEFVGEGDLCLWKDLKGSLKLGYITDNPAWKYDENILQLPTTISFNFTESGDINKVSVYSTEEVSHNARG